jgi:hypothetical protein
MQNFEIDGRKALGFDTGLDSRAFAQAKLAQFITEPGLIVRSGAVELWQASGVREVTASDGKQTMVVWGPPVDGECLDTMLNNAPQDKILAAISAWIQAILLLKNNECETPLWPCAAMFSQGSAGTMVFFAPPGLARHEAVTIDERYVNPGFSGMNAAAFTVAAMLYHACAGTPPFSAGDKSLLYQDMREGNFLPIRFAVPGLNERLAALIQNALVPFTAKGGTITDGTRLLEAMLECVQAQQSSILSLVRPLSQAEQLSLEKEKHQYLKIKTASITTKRFVARNAALLAGCLAVIMAVTLGVHSCAQSRARLPSMAGMEPVRIIETYYYAIGDLDHQMMEACVSGNAGKNDIRMVINFFVIEKTRQSYAHNALPIFIPAHKWPDGHTDIPIFGPADLKLEWLEGGEENGEIHYRADYTFWTPSQLVDEAESAEIEDPLSLPYPRSDIVTLIRKKGNWRISEIKRE